MGKLLHEDTVKAVICIKEGYRENDKNYGGLEAFLRFWKRENEGFENHLDYIKDGAPQRLRWALEDLVECSEHPERLFRDYLNFEDEYERMKSWNFLSEVEKLAGPRLYALAHTLWNVQIRDHSDKGELHCINGFTEEAMDAAAEYIGVAEDEDEE